MKFPKPRVTMNEWLFDPSPFLSSFGIFSRRSRLFSFSRTRVSLVQSAVHIPIQLGIITFPTIRGISATPVDPGDQTGDRTLEKRRDQQVIFNPCPEFLGGMRARQSSQSLRCGGVTSTKGVCDKLWLGRLQDDRCYAQGGCVSFYLCIPDSYYANGPSIAVQFIGIQFPDTYGLPKQKCSDLDCGGDVYFPGFCENILVSGAQGPGCPKPGCGMFCQCDPTTDVGPPASISSSLPETTTSFRLNGTKTASLRSSVSGALFKSSSATCWW